MDRRLFVAARWAVLVASVAGTSQTLDAQVVRGTVNSAAGSPIAGAVIQLLDSAQNDRGRALTSERGTFVIRASAPGRYRVVARAIGYRPATTALLDVHRDTAIAFSLDRVATMLSTVKTLAQNPCSAHPDTASMTWEIWDQAIAAMLGAAITMGDREKEFKFALSNRVYGLGPRGLQSIEFAETTLCGTKPWTSYAPDSLALNGYVFATDTGGTYIAPDLDVLISRSFAATHCFREHEGSRPNRNLIGVDFEPASGIAHPDIKGTFWLDAASRELRVLEFTYDHLPIVRADTLAGGRIEFVRLVTGEWIISDWEIRAPLASAFARARAQRARKRTADEVIPRLAAPTEVHVKRGNLIEAAAPGENGLGVVWTRSVASLHASVTNSSGLPAAGAVVRLPQSLRQTVTDSLGSGRFDGLIDGDYLVTATTSEYDALFYSPEHQTITVPRSGEVSVRLRLASVEQVIKNLCGTSVTVRAEVRGILVGTITRGGAPEVGATVTVAPSNSQSYKATSQKDGTYRVCNVPRNVDLDFAVVTKDGIRMSGMARIMTGKEFQTADVIIHPKSP